MRIIFSTTNFYPPQSYGGSELSTHDLSTLLLKRGHQVAVLAALRSKGWTWLVNRMKKRLSSVNTFPMDRQFGYPVFRGWDPRLGIAEVSSRFRPDIAVIQAGRQPALAEGFRKENVPSVIYLRDVEFKHYGGFISNEFNYIANSNFTADVLQEKSGISAKVIPPIIHSEKYRVKTSEEFVTFVNPIQTKGLEIALSIAEACPEIPFLFVQSWILTNDQWKILSDRTRTLKNVTLTKSVRDMRSVYKRTKIILVPSICQEAWGRVVSEAQISGIPAIASKRGGLPESVGTGGVLIDPDSDVGEWVNALNLLWRDETAYSHYSELAFKYAQRKEIDPEFLLQSFLNILSDIAATR